MFSIYATKKPLIQQKLHCYPCYMEGFQLELSLGKKKEPDALKMLR